MGSIARIVIVGGGPAGRAAAFRARRQNESAAIVVVDRASAISEGDVSAIRSRYAIDVRIGVEAIAIDPKSKEVRVGGAARRDAGESYDTLVLASGVRPILPPGLTVDDARASVRADVRNRRVIVLGSGIVAVDAAIRACSASAEEVRVLVPGPTFLPDLDDEMAAIVVRRLASFRVAIESGVGVAGVTKLTAGTASRVTLESGASYDADVVVPALGVHPEVTCAASAGINLGATGAIAVGRRMETNVADVYAAGGCAEAPHAILMYDATWEPSLGSAVRSGHIAGASAAGATNETFDGVLATKFASGVGLELGKLGLTEKEALERHYDVVIAHAHPNSFSGVRRNGSPIVVKLVLDKMSGWILGVQAVGESAVGSILDVFATAIVGGTPIDKVAQLDLAASGLGDGWSPASISARVAENAQRGFVDTVSASALRRELVDGLEPRPNVLDVRAASRQAPARIPGAIAIPLADLRSRIEEIAIDRPIVVCSETGESAYVAARILSQRGRTVRILSGGMACWPFEVTSAGGSAP